jgi:methyl-accepting chemotaxis protein
MVDSITEAASDQEQSIHVVVRAMNDMRDSAGQTDRMAHTIAQVSDVLRGHSQALAETVKELEEQVHGTREVKATLHSLKPPTAGKNESPHRRSA